MKKVRGFIAFLWCILIVLPGCSSNQEVEIQPKVVTQTESGFEKFLRENCPNFEELSAQGLNCDGEPLNNFIETGECLPGETAAYNEGGEMICVTHEELAQIGEERLNELIDESIKIN